MKQMPAFFSKSTIKFFAIFFVMAVFLFSQNEVLAAHTFDTSARSSLQTTNPATLSYTAGSGTTVLVVMLAHTQASRTGGAPTYNGITMTQVDGEVLNQQEVGAEMWYLIDPPTGSAYTISVPNTGAGSIRIYGASFKAQSGYTSALDVSNTTNTDTANPSLTLTTTVNGAAVIDILADGDPDVPTGRSHTLIGSADENQRTNEAQYALQATAGLITLSHTIPSDDVAMIAVAFKEVAKTTTLATGTDPSNAPLAPGGSATMADAFTFQTNTGTDSITVAVVGLASGTSGGLSLVEITNDAGSVVYGSTANPVSDTPSISLSGLTATTVSTQYKIRVTPKSHASMPVPPGSTYSVTAKINSWIGANSQAGSDIAGTTVTIDNASPSATTGASATEGDTQITVSWTNPTGDFSNIVVLRDTATIGSSSTPAEGTSPSVGSSCGGTACQVRHISTGTSFIDTGLTNGTTYYYRLFPKDTSGNYTAYASTQQVSAMPAAAPDTAPPTPNPMTFASVPTNDSATQISMTSTTGSDATTPINYLFTNNNTSCGANAGTGGTSSSWQSSTSYADTGLQANKCYGYTVQARDSVTPTPNTGTASAISSTYTSANTPGAPTLNSPTTSTLNLTNAENGNPVSNPTTNFAIQIVTTSDATWLNKWVNTSGNPSATAVWMTDAVMDTLMLQGLQSGTLYGAKVKARNQDGDETVLGAEGQGTTSAPAATTAISNFVTAEPSNNTIAPGTSELVDSFGLQTSTGSDTVTGTTVTLASGTGARIATVAITNNGDTTTYCSSAPSGDTATLTGCGIPVNTTNTQFKIKITAASHTMMPVPPGASYAVTGRITAFTSTNAQSGSDSGSATLTIDNLSPSATTGTSAAPGDAQVTVSWTNPSDSDFQKVIIYCKTSSITEAPTEGSDPSVDGATCNGTVRVKYSGSTSPQIFTGLTNGTTYYFRIYARDTNGNFTAYSAAQEVSAAPAATTYTITATAGLNGTITPPGVTTVAQGGSQMYTITPDTGYNINTLLIDGGPISTSTTYTFTDVQGNHTIEATFIAIPTPPGSFSIAASAGTGGTISPSGLITVTEGDSQMFTITPDIGYNIASILIDGAPLAATSTTYTFTNVTTNHTIEATFTTPEAPVVPVRRAPRPITVTFSGKAFPHGKIAVIDKELASGTMTARDITADITGAFSISFVDIIVGAHTFGILAKDKDGRSSQSKFYTIELSAQQLEERNILLPPTIDLVRGQISRGKNATVIGFASPNSILRIEINGILVKETPANADGSYRIDIPTGALDFGQHKVRVRQYSQALGQTSDYSPLRSLIVSRLITTEADFSGDGKIDIQDWSIFLSRWISKEPVLRQSIDLNGDGKVNIADFSIFIRAIRRVR